MSNDEHGHVRPVDPLLLALELAGDVLGLDAVALAEADDQPEEDAPRSATNQKPTIQKTSEKTKSMSARVGGADGTQCSIRWNIAGPPQRMTKTKTTTMKAPTVPIESRKARLASSSEE